MNKDAVIAKLVYFLYQLGYMALVGGFIAFLMMIMGIDIQQHAGVIGITMACAWGAKERELKGEGEQKDNEKEETKKQVFVGLTAKIITVFIWIVAILAIGFAAFVVYQM